MNDKDIDYSEIHEYLRLNGLRILRIGNRDRLSIARHTKGGRPKLVIYGRVVYDSRRDTGARHPEKPLVNHIIDRVKAAAVSAQPFDRMRRIKSDYEDEWRENYGKE